MFDTRRLLLVSLLLLFLPVIGSAATLTVPAQYATIQAAIDAAYHGCVVVVSPGTYKECIDYKGKAITVRSTAPEDPSVVAATIIDGEQKDTVVTFESDERATSVLMGLTITNGNGGGGSGGISCGNSSPTITNNVIVGNSTIDNGGGIECDGGSAVVTDNIITGNSAGQGGGILIKSCASPIVRRNVIFGNTAQEGGGIGCYWSWPNIVGNTIWGNCAAQGGGMWLGEESSPAISNSIIAFNTSGGGIYVGQDPLPPSMPLISYCDVYDNAGGNFVNFTDATGTNGNISADPLFADAANGDYRLKSRAGRWNGSAWVTDTVTSPCIDAGDPTSDFALEPAPNGGRVNMGFDGNTAYASKSPVAAPAPTVVASGPNGTTVGVAANINITFSDTMARPTAQSAMTINGVRASTFGGTFTWSGRKMTFNPTNNLQPGTTYKIIVARGARSRAGLSMARGVMWTFTTKPAAPAAVTVASAPTALGAQIMVNLASAADVTVSIRNLAGRNVALVQPGRLEAGVHSLLWNGKSTAGTKAPAGVYLVQVTAKAADGTACSAMTTLRK
jgi:hypothetical protein